MSLHARGAAAARFVAVLIFARHTLGIPLERHDSGTSTAVVLWHGEPLNPSRELHPNQ